MARTRLAEFANVVVRFGNEKVLIDYVQEIVIPAFLDNDFVREHRKTNYFFLDQEIIEVEHAGKRQGVLVGRFVKDTLLVSAQEWDQSKKAIIQKAAQIPTAPSAVFALILNTHRMVFLHETSYAPTLKNFEVTLESALRKQHDRYLDSLIDEKFPDTPKRNRERSRYAKQLRASIPRPDVEVRPLSSIGDVKNYIAKFSALYSISIELGKTNHDIDSSEFLKTFRGQSELISGTGKMQFADKQNGLDKQQSIKLAVAATEQGINTVTVEGIDSNGEKIKGTNEDLKARAQIPVSEEREDTKAIGRKLVDKLATMESAGILKQAEPNQPADAKVIDLLELRGGQE